MKMSASEYESLPSYKTRSLTNDDVGKIYKVDMLDQDYYSSRLRWLLESKLDNDELVYQMHIVWLSE